MSDSDSIQPITKIITHPGGAHKDEFLAVSVLLHFHPNAEILRRDPSEQELQDPEIAVVDIGHQHEPALSNFDHHQFPRDHTPTCSLSLILQHFGIYEAAKTFCEWVETLEWFDSKGAISTSEWLDTSFEAVRKLNSPIDVTILKWFASNTHIKPGDPVWEMMKLHGSGMVDYVNGMSERMAYIAQHSETWTVSNGKTELRYLFMPRTDPLPKDPSLGLSLYLNDATEPYNGLIYPDKRGDGYGLSRYNDDPKLDFTQITDESDVHFAHSRGFLAKSSATDVERLKELAKLSIVE